MEVPLGAPASPGSRIPTTMRLLCCSDLHNGVADATHLAARAREEGVDAILAAGDLGHWQQHDERLWSALAASGKPVYCVRGNHDIAAAWEGMLWQVSATDLGGRLVRIQDIYLAGWDWQWSAGADRPGPDPKLQALRALHRDVNPRKLVLVAHLPPWGVRVARTRDDAEDLGDDHLREWVEEVQPWAVVCGHVHFPKARTSRIGETLIVNGGREGYVLGVG